MPSENVLRSYRDIPVQGLTKIRTAAPEQRFEASTSRVPRQTFIYFYGFDFQSGVLFVAQNYEEVHPNVSVGDSHSWTRNTSTLRCNAVNENNPRRKELVALCVSQMTISSLNVKYYTIFHWKLSVWDVQRIIKIVRTSAQRFCSLRSSDLQEQDKITWEL
jgi:hypothetical protein